MSHINEDKTIEPTLVLSNPYFFIISLTIVFILGLIGSLFLNIIAITYLGYVMIK